METESNQHIVVTDIRMSFWSMVVFMVKWAIAAIPAFIILAVLWGIVVWLVGITGSMMGMGH